MRKRHFPYVLEDLEQYGKKANIVKAGFLEKSKRFLPLLHIRECSKLPQEDLSARKHSCPVCTGLHIAETVFSGKITFKGILLSEITPFRDHSFQRLLFTEINPERLDLIFRHAAVPQILFRAVL